VDSLRDAGEVLVEYMNSGSDIHNSEPVGR
jgi:hypothetical protein